MADGVMKIPQHYPHFVRRARFSGCGSLSPAMEQACCRLPDAHSAAASSFTAIRIHTTVDKRFSEKRTLCY